VRASCAFRLNPGAAIVLPLESPSVGRRAVHGRPAPVRHLPPVPADRPASVGAADALPLAPSGLAASTRVRGPDVPPTRPRRESGERAGRRPTRRLALGRAGYSAAERPRRVGTGAEPPEVAVRRRPPPRPQGQGIFDPVRAPNHGYGPLRLARAGLHPRVLARGGALRSRVIQPRSA